MPQNYVPIFIFIAIVGIAAADHSAAGEAGASVESQQDEADAV